MGYPKYNASGLSDPTAWQAMEPIAREDEELEKRVTLLVRIIKQIVDIAGFDLMTRIEVRDRRSGRVFR